jgi:hypothetical protein
LSINTVSKLLEDAGLFCAGYHDAKVRNVKPNRVQVDEIWSFTYAKAKNVETAKAAPAGAGDTSTWTAIEAPTKLLVKRLHQTAPRAATALPNAPARSGTLSKQPDPKHISTSYSERVNLTMRVSNRRFIRLTNAFSKKFDNHAHMVAIYAVWYNFVRIHKTFRVTPAMASGLSATVMDWTDIVEMVDADLPAKKRSPYKKGSIVNGF